MKPTLLLAILCVVFLSCTQFQYLTVSGINVSKNDKNDLIAENDTLKVQYGFTEYQGKVGITLTNKTDQPIEIDWQKSALIVDGKAVSYYNPNATFSGRIQNDTFINRSSINTNAVYLADLQGNILVNTPLQFIPPRSSVFKAPLNLLREPLQNLPEQEGIKESIKTSGYEVGSYKRLNFQAEKSPVYFRSYLTLRIGSGALQNEFTLEHYFYVSEVWKTAIAPQDFPNNTTKRADRFYLTP